jgi:hypothetical protein
VILRDVCIPEDAFVPLGGSGRSNAVQDRGLVWFELLIATCYVGIASNLVERVLLSGRGSAEERVRLAIETEGAMSALEAIARSMCAGEYGNDELARTLLVRFAVQEATQRVASLAVELLGGDFFRSPEVAYLLAATRVLSIHPPARMSASKHLDEYLTGSPIVLD